MDDKRSPIQTKLAKMRGMNCFVCAPRSQNPIGLALEFEATPEGAKVNVQFGESFQSYPGIVHGGVISAVMDETMAYAIILKHGVLPFTSSLKVEYRMPVESGKSFVCEARVVSREGNRFRVDARLKDEKGRAVILAAATFVCPTAQLAKRMIPGAQWTAVEELLS